jgi:hypothetical protein
MLEDSIVALAAFTIPSNKLDINETVTIALVAMCTFSPRLTSLPAWLVPPVLVRVRVSVPTSWVSPGQAQRRR